MGYKKPVLGIKMLFKVVVLMAATLCLLPPCGGVENRTKTRERTEYCSHRILLEKDRTGICTDTKFLQHLYQLQAHYSSLKQQQNLQREIARVLKLENSILRERVDWLQKISKLEERVEELTREKIQCEEENLNQTKSLLKVRDELYSEKHHWETRYETSQMKFEDDRAMYTNQVSSLQEQLLESKNKNVNLSAEVMQLDYQLMVANEKIAHLESETFANIETLQQCRENSAHCDQQLVQVWEQYRNESEGCKSLKIKAAQLESHCQLKSRSLSQFQAMGKKFEEMTNNILQPSLLTDVKEESSNDKDNNDFEPYLPNEIQKDDKYPFINTINQIPTDLSYELFAAKQLGNLLQFMASNYNLTQQIHSRVQNLENTVSNTRDTLELIRSNQTDLENLISRGFTKLAYHNSTYKVIESILEDKWLDSTAPLLVELIGNQTGQVRESVLNFTKWLHCLWPNKPKDCSEICFIKQRLNPVQTIYLGDNLDPITVICQEGWTLIQHKTDEGGVDFDRNWDEYKTGFGNVKEDGDFWLGNDIIHQLTKHQDYKIHIDMISHDFTWYFAEYKNFSIGTEEDNYELRVGKFHGSLPDALNINNMQYVSNGQAFTTKDHDNDGWAGGNNANAYGGGWWYNYGTNAPLNGWSMWYQGKKDPIYLKRVTMKIRPMTQDDQF